MAERLQNLRSRAGYGARELSRLVGASPAMIYHLERGLIERPSAEIAIRLAAALGTTPQYLVLGEGNPPSTHEIDAAVERAKAERVNDVGSKTGTEG